MKVTEFDYDLPKELIAQTPIEKRDESRLMVLNRKTKTIEHKIFKDIKAHKKIINRTSLYIIICNKSKKDGTKSFHLFILII